MTPILNMEICHPHNLSRPYRNVERRYGIRVSLPAGDTFASIIGGDWEQHHWYPTPQERDSALAEMRRRHEYSREGDLPTLQYEAVERSS